MFKNKIAVKLSFYFAVALFLFSVIIGGTFILLFRNHTVTLYKNQLLARAESIASTLSGYMEGGSMTHGMMGGYGAYLQFIGDIAGTDVWIVDEDLNLVTSGMGHGMMCGVYSYSYSDLPKNAEGLIKDVFTGGIAFSEDFSGIFSEPTLTVGVPIKSGKNRVIGVVLLHSPVSGVDEAISEGGKLLAVSLSTALVIVFLLSAWLSKNFTDPIILKEAQDAIRLENIRRDFVANISHELRTPITVIRGSLEALTEKIVTDPVQIENYHNQMLDETLFLQRLVNDLLDLSRLQNADFIIEKQNISICDILDDIMRSASQVAREKNVRINLSKDSGNCVIYGDYGRIRQMLMIIIDNAIKFSYENNRVDIILSNKVLSIRDYGTGIPENDLPFIFDRFYKSRSEQNKSGTGLGLAIAKQIADRHGIRLTAQPPEGGGAMFLLTF